MSTRRTTMKTRPSGRRAHAAATPHVTAAQVGAKLDAVEKKILRARKSAVKVARNSMQEAVTAAKFVSTSMKEAVAAVKRATRRVAKRVSSATQPAKPAATTAKRKASKTRKGGHRLAA